MRGRKIYALLDRKKDIRVLLVRPPFYTSYTISKVKNIVPFTPSLTLATIAPYIVKENVIVEILDLQISENPMIDLRKRLKRFLPDIVGVTFLTPSYNFVKHVIDAIRKFNSKIIIFGGGPHVSAFPKESLKEMFDFVLIGESELALKKMFSGENLKNICGVGFKTKNNKITVNKSFQRISDLDELLYPAWDLFNLKNYISSRSFVRRNPVGSMESSRGCPFTCDFCNKNIFGYKFRAKSAKRTVDEMEYMLSIGFNEIHVQDDGFSTNLKRAKDVCDEIIKRKLDFPWNFPNGIRADRFDEDLARKLVKAGCYNVCFGIESANQELLESSNKNMSLEIIKKAIRVANDAGLQTTGYFMFGFPGETEKTMEETITFAINSNLDLAKLAILTPLPGTKRFRDWDKQGLIKSKDWSKYNTHKPDEVYTHPNLSWEEIYNYYSKFYRKFYLRPSFIFSRMRKSIVNKTLLSDINLFFKTRF